MKNIDEILKKFPISQYLNADIASEANLPLFKIKKLLAKKKLKRSQVDEISLEEKHLRSHWNSEGLHFRGAFDGITHYLIWLLTFVMPLFVPYFENYIFSRGAEQNPSLFQTIIIYILFAPLCAWLIFRLTIYFQKRNSPLTEKILLGTVLSALFLGTYKLLCSFSILPNILFYSSTDDPITVWFSSFSNGKFFFTYTTIILITLAFWLQQYFNRDRLVFRFPLRKIILSFFFIHLVSLYYPLAHPEDSILNESLMRLQQWIQYFLLFIIIVNSTTTIGRLISISKASSISGTVVALIGIGQEFFTTSFEKFISTSVGVKTITSSFVLYNPGDSQPFSTFGHNNFAAAYVCLSTPITISLIAYYFTKLIQENKNTSRADWSSLAFFILAPLIQLIYLATSLGKAGIVSMIAALIFCSIFMCFLLTKKTRYKIFKIAGLYSFGGLVLAIISIKILLALPITSHQIEQISDKWNDKFSNSFDPEKGSNRVRLSYVGGALSLSLVDPAHILTGVGANNYKYHYPRLRDTREADIEKGRHVLQAHGDFAQFAADTGIMGFLIFGLLIIYPVIFGGHLLLKEEDISRKILGLGFLCTLVAMAVNSLFFFPFQTPGSLLPYFMSLGLLFSYEKKRHEHPVALKLTMFCLILTALTFYIYEAWYFSRYEDSLFTERLIHNVLLISSGVSLIFIFHYLLRKKDLLWPSIITHSSKPLFFFPLFVLYVGFAYFFCFSYLYTDHIKFAHVEEKVEHLKRLYNQVTKDAEGTRAELKKNYALVENVFQEIHFYKNKAVQLNPHNPDIHLIMSQSINYLMNLHHVAFGENPTQEEIHKFWTLRELQDLNLRELLAADKAWPMNRDIFFQLSQVHLNLAYTHRKNFEKYNDHLYLALQRARQSLDIWPNDIYSLDNFLKSAEALRQVGLVQDYYITRLKDNPFIDYKINNALANFFDSHHLKDLSLEIRIKDFITRVRAGEQIEVLDELMKNKKDYSGKQIYPKGVLELLNKRRHDGTTVLENIKTNQHTYMLLSAYNKIVELLINDRRFKDAEEIQNFYLTLILNHVEIKNQLHLRSQMKPKESLDETILRLAKNSSFIERTKLIQEESTAWYLVKVLNRSNNERDKKYAKRIFKTYICENPLTSMKKFNHFKALYSEISPGSSFIEYLHMLYNFNKLGLKGLNEKGFAKKFFSSYRL